MTNEVLKKVDECKKNEKFNQKIEMRYLTLKLDIDKMREKLSKIKYYGDVKCSKCGSTDIFPCYIEKKEEGEEITFQCHQCINRFVVTNKEGKFDAGN